MFSDETIERFSRQLILKGFGPKAQKKLFDASILVIGAGGLGSPALLYLTTSGVGKIGVADFDKVDISNLQRQIIFSESDVNLSKAESAVLHLQKRNRHTQFKIYKEKITAANIIAIIDDYDFIVDGTDTLSSKLLINDACVLAEKPFCHAGALELSGQIMTVIPYKSACLRCALGDVSELETLSCSQAGILGPVVGMLGTLQALEAIKFLTDTGKILTNSVLSFDGIEMRFQKVNISKRSDCPVCGVKPVIVNLHEKDYLSCH